MNDNLMADATTRQIALLAPELVLLGFGCLAFLLDAFAGSFKAEVRRTFWAVALLAALATAWALLLAQPAFVDPAAGRRPPDQDEITRARVALFAPTPHSTPLRLVAYGAGFVFALLAWSSFPARLSGELFGCTAMMLAGTGLVALSADLVSLFLSLELVSIPTYVLLALHRRDTPGYEAAIKYFLLSIFSSGLFLYGASLLYGAAGVTHLGTIHETLRRDGSVPDSPLLLAGCLLMVAGLGFRVTAVPFHFYAPDVFAGSSLPVAGLLSVLPKVAGFAALHRVLAVVAPLGWLAESQGAGAQVIVFLFALAAVTMTVGNLLAFEQASLRRLLAYSSVANGGYMLVALATLRLAPSGAASFAGMAALVFYLAAYAVMTLGFFAVLNHLEEEAGRRIDAAADLNGLFRRRPGLAVLAAVLLFSLAGVPPTAGFFGKLLIFFAAWSEGSAHQELLPGSLAAFHWLSLIMAVNAAIGAAYYLRLIAAMFLGDPRDPAPAPASFRLDPCLAAAGLCGLATVGMFFIPPGLLLGR